MRMMFPRTVFPRTVLAASILGGALALGASVAPPALAQGAGQPDESAPKQVALTQAELDNLVAAQKDVQSVAGDKPGAGNEAKLTAAVKAHGFDSVAQFSAVSYSVGLVMAGIDPQTKEFVGPAAVLKKQIADVEADKSMSAKDKKDALAELNEALKEGSSDTPSPANIAVVKTNYDKLSAALQQSE